MSNKNELKFKCFGPTGGILLTLDGDKPRMITSIAFIVDAAKNMVAEGNAVADIQVAATDSRYTIRRSEIIRIIDAAIKSFHNPPSAWVAIVEDLEKQELRDPDTSDGVIAKITGLFAHGERAELTSDDGQCWYTTFDTLNTLASHTSSDSKYAYIVEGEFDCAD